MSEIQTPKEVILPVSEQPSWLVGLVNKVGKIINKDRKSGEPHVSIHIVYGPHGSKKEAQVLEEDFKRADVFIPEASGWNMGAAVIYNDLSFGKITAREAMKQTTSNFRSHQFGEFEMVAGSKKPIVFIDLPQEDKPQREKPLTSQLFRNLRGKYYNRNGTFDDMLVSVRDYFEQNAGYQIQRESHMISQLPDVIKRVLKNTPTLKGKDHINVLMALGSLHTKVSHSLLKLGYDVTRKFNPSLPIYSLYDEATRRYIFGKDVDDLFLARVLLWVFVMGGKMDTRLEKLTEDEGKKELFLRKAISRFSLEDINSFFEDSRKGHINGSDFASYAFNRKEVEFPRNEAELDKFLAV